MTSIAPRPTSRGFLGGLRTPAPVSAAAASWAGIRKPSQTATWRKVRVISVLAPITDSVSTMRGWSYLPAPKEQLLAPPNRPRLAENKRSGSALRSQCRRGDDVVAGPPEQQRHDGAIRPSRT